MNTYAARSLRLALILSVVAALSGCGSQSMPGASPSPSPSVNTRDDETTIYHIELEATELPSLTTLYDSNGHSFTNTAAPWTMIYDGLLTLPASGPGCLTHVPHYTSAYAREFSYNLQKNGLEGGHAAVTVFAASSADDIASAQRDVATAQYQGCYADQSVRAYLNQAGVQVTGATTTKNEPVDVGVPNVTVLYMTPYTFQAKAKVMYTEVSWTSFDRFRAISYVETCCGQPGTADVRASLALIAQRLERAAGVPNS